MDISIGQYKERDMAYRDEYERLSRIINNNDVKLYYTVFSYIGELAKKLGEGSELSNFEKRVLEYLEKEVN